jgi:hypothetical protein
MVSGRAHPTRGSRAGLSVEQMLNRVGRIFGGVRNRRAPGDIDLVGSATARSRRAEPSSAVGFSMDREFRMRWLREASVLTKRKSGSQPTRRWREMDSNLWSPSALVGAGSEFQGCK